MNDLRWYRTLGGLPMSWQETLAAMTASYGTYDGFWHDNAFWAAQAATVFTEATAEERVREIHAHAAERSAAWHAANPGVPPVFTPDPAPAWAVLVRPFEDAPIVQEGVFLGEPVPARTYAESRRADLDADQVQLLPLAAAITAAYADRLAAAERALFGDDGEAS